MASSVSASSIPPQWNKLRQSNQEIDRMIDWYCDKNSLNRNDLFKDDNNTTQTKLTVYLFDHWKEQAPYIQIPLTKQDNGLTLYLRVMNSLLIPLDKFYIYHGELKFMVGDSSKQLDYLRNPDIASKVYLVLRDDDKNEYISKLESDKLPHRPKW
jgi:hypothetical protein